MMKQRIAQVFPEFRRDLAAVSFDHGVDPDETLDELEQLFTWLSPNDPGNHLSNPMSRRIKAIVNSVSSSPPLLEQVFRHYMSEVKVHSFNWRKGKSVDEMMGSLDQLTQLYEFPFTVIGFSESHRLQFQSCLTSLFNRFFDGKEVTVSDIALRNIQKYNLDLEHVMIDKFKRDIVEIVNAYRNFWDCSTTLADLEFALVDRHLYTDDLGAFALDQLYQMRLAEVFDMVKAFPKSKCGLKELRGFVYKANGRRSIHNSFVAQCKEKILNPGVETLDVICFYLKTIKSMQEIDPSGVLSSNADKVFQSYLKDRSDTVQLIVHSLLNVGVAGKELHEHLLTELTAHTTHNMGHDFTMDWLPDPIDAPNDFKRTKDMVDNLISIYDTKDVFVTEILNMFSKHLLELKGYDVSRVNEQLDMLKLKFSDQHQMFDNLNVMVSDIEKSSFLDREIRNKNIRASILSYHYWQSLPKFDGENEEDDFSLPQQLETEIQQFSTAYNQTQLGRKLYWHKSLGSVNLTLQVGMEEKTFDVSPDKASVIHCFADSVSGEHPRLSLLKVSEMTKLNESRARNALLFWCRNSVLRQVDSEYIVCGDYEAEPVSATDTTVSASGVVEEEDEEKALLQSMAKYWPFINGMLTNLGSMTAERMHSFLNMVVPKDIGYSATEPQLKSYLEAMCEEEKLVKAAEGSYKLKK